MRNDSVEIVFQSFSQPLTLRALQAKIKELEKKCQVQEKRQEDLKAEVQTLRQQKEEQDYLLRQHEQQQQTPGSSSRRPGSPVTPGGIPPSDSADSGLPASGANSDEGAWPVCARARVCVRVCVCVKFLFTLSLSLSVCLSVSLSVSLSLSLSLSLSPPSLSLSLAGCA